MSKRDACFANKQGLHVANDGQALNDCSIKNLGYWKHDGLIMCTISNLITETTITSRKKSHTYQTDPVDTATTRDRRRFENFGKQRPINLRNNASRSTFQPTRPKAKNSARRANNTCRQCIWHFSPTGRKKSHLKLDTSYDEQQRRQVKSRPTRTKPIRHEDLITQHRCATETWMTTGNKSCINQLTNPCSFRRRHWHGGGRSSTSSSSGSYRRAHHLVGKQASWIRCNCSHWTPSGRLMPTHCILRLTNMMNMRITLSVDWWHVWSSHALSSSQFARGRSSSRNDTPRWLRDREMQWRWPQFWRKLSIRWTLLIEWWLPFPTCRFLPRHETPLCVLNKAFYPTCHLLREGCRPGNVVLILWCVSIPPSGQR